MTKILLIFAIFATFISFSDAKCILEGGDIECSDLHDGDLPGAVEAFSGNYDRLQLNGNPDLTILKRDSFPGISFGYVNIGANENLETIEYNFLRGGEAATTQMDVMQCPKLRDFPFSYMTMFTNMWLLKIYSSGIEVIPSDAPNPQWPESLTQIEMRYNTKIRSIMPNAFAYARKLEQLWIGEVADGCEVQSGGLETHTTKDATLILYPTSGYIRLKANAFGNVLSPEYKLWDRLNLGTSDFNEDALRLLFKAHYDKGSIFFMTNIAASNSINSCDNICDHAWLYKDALMLGPGDGIVDAFYYNIVGRGNAACPGLGPILDIVDAEIVAEMKSCPCETYFCDLIHGQNYCEGAQQTIVPDPDDCHCFYHCNQNHVEGEKECCEPGLVFNPDLLACDWPFNVENCD